MDRKKISTLCLLFFFVVFLPVQVLAAQFLRTTTDLRLRAGAGTGTAVLDVIPSGTELEILGTTGDWAKTSYNGQTGYSSLVYLAPTAASTMTMVTIDLRLRSGPSTAYSILTTIPRYTPVPILSQSGNWTKTIWSGRVGWIGTTYTKPVADLPRLETTLAINLRSGPGTAYAIIQKVPLGTRVPVLTVSASGNWVKTWVSGRIGWLSRKYLKVPSVSFRPASPPSSILDYSNEKLSWSAAYPQDSYYGYPDLGGRYRYSDGRVHLTLDLGYENGLTAGFLDVLKAKNVKVRFYVTGYYLRSRPDLVRRMLAEGHIVGNHSDQHDDAVDLMADSMQAVYDDLRVWEEEYRRITGQYPSRWFYRPPSGIFSQRTLGLLHWMGYTSEVWQVALADWDPDHQLTPEYTLDRLMTDTKQGSIVLLHGVSSTNLTILGQYIDRIRAKGWTFADPWQD